MKARLTDEAVNQRLPSCPAGARGGRQRCRRTRQRDALCGLGNDVLCSHRGAPLGPTVELRGFGTKQCDELSVIHGLAFGVPLLLGIRSRRTAELCAKTAKGSRLRIRWCHRHTHEDVVGFRPDVVEAAFVLDNVPDSRKVVERPFLVGPTPA
jgi:hypothetical protein